MTAPMVRSRPTIGAMSSMVMPFCRPTTSPSAATSGLMQLARPARVVGLHEHEDDVEGLAQGRDLAQVVAP